VAFRKHHRNWNGLLAFMRAGKDAKRSQYNTMARRRAVYPIFLAPNGSFGPKAIAFLQDLI
jgi:hypothetical protein